MRVRNLNIYSVQHMNFSKLDKASQKQAVHPRIRMGNRKHTEDNRDKEENENKATKPQVFNKEEISEIFNPQMMR